MKAVQPSTTINIKYAFHLSLLFLHQKREREKKKRLFYTVKACTFKLLQGKKTITHPTWLHCVCVRVCFKRSLVNLKVLVLVWWLSKPSLVMDRVSDTQGFCLLRWHALLNKERLLKLCHTSSRVFSKHSKEKERKKDTQGTKKFSPLMFLAIEFLQFR